ncbi:MAG TPA: flagellar M-ring protein FliF C-terminal domain-containing protein, partial [Sphingomonas sp.]|nr:flagellar M-ring protein FliF C-terminal domain-containing protein [Sphingomonas sp.]
VGAGKVRAEVAATIDRDQTREEASAVDPDKQAIAHQVTVESNDQSDENGAATPVASVAQQLPAAGTTTPPGGDSRRSRRGETSEDTTYENSRTNTVRVRAPGAITRLTVAVMVDAGERGLPPQELQRLQRLVENAVGFDAQRGDNVAVESMPFAAADAGAADQNIFSNLPLDQIFGVLKLLIIAGVALLAVRMLRPKYDRRRSEEASVPAQDALAAPAQEPLALPTGSTGIDEAALLAAAEGQVNLLDQEVALAQVDGRVKLSAIKRIGEAVSASPAEAASVIRQWMAA